MNKISLALILISVALIGLCCASASIQPDKIILSGIKDGGVSSTCANHGIADHADNDAHDMSHDIKVDSLPGIGINDSDGLLSIYN